MIFLPDVRWKKAAVQRADELIGSLQKLFCEHVDGWAFSCSIGLAFSECPGTDYQELFNRADRALYRAKAAGKNRCVCYCGDMEGQYRHAGGKRRGDAHSD